MPAPFCNLEEKLEDAIKSLIEALDDPGVRIARGFTGDEATEPSVTILANSSKPTIDEEGPVPTGTRDVSVTLEIRSHNGLPADESAEWDAQGVTNARDAHARLVARVIDLFHDAAIVSQLNAQAVQDLTVQAVYVQDRRRTVRDNSFVSEQDLTVTCHPS